MNKKVFFYIKPNTAVHALSNKTLTRKRTQQRTSSQAPQKKTKRWKR